MKIRLAGIIESLTNGEGLRKVIFSKGCNHNCYNCQNADMNSFIGGELFEIDDLVEDILETTYLKGVTFSGGDPFKQADKFSELAIKLKKNDINIWCYTGYYFEELLHLSMVDENVYNLLHNIDVLVDGRYIDKLKSDEIKFRGSKNQSIINVPESFKKNILVLVEKYRL